MARLEERVKNYYQTHSLTLAQIQVIQKAAKPRPYLRLWNNNLLKYAAVILVSLNIFYGLYTFIYEPNTLAEKFAHEIALNYKKGEPVVIESGNIQTLRAGLDKLNFELTLPPSITDNFKLIGGKYCSVDNRIAAQIKLEDENGSEITCYVFKKEEAINFKESIVKEQVKVKLWDDGQRIFGLAVAKK